MTDPKTGNAAIREALGLFHSMVRAGEALSPQAQEVWDRAWTAADPDPETVEEQAAQGVVLANALEPIVQKWLDENGDNDEASLFVSSEDVPDLVAFLAGELVAAGFGRR